MHAITLLFAITLLAFWPGLSSAQCNRCKGDFDGDGRVTVDEIIVTVNDALDNCALPGTRFTDNGDGTVTDTRTALMWEKKSADGSTHDVGSQYRWDDASSVFVTTLNATLFAGHSDWRLPTVAELQSLIDYGRPALEPATDPAFNTACTSGCSVTTCSCTQRDYYWSSTAYQDPSVPDFVWNVDFNFGAVNGYEKSIPAYYARAVRSGT